MSHIKSPDFVVHYPPTRPTLDKTSIILFGTIQRGEDDWREVLASSLSDLPIAILNPHRDDWDSSWVEDMSDPKFKEQVNWEMDYAQKADIIVFNFAPDSLAPVSMLELGMYAGTGKVILRYHEEFKKKGNLQAVCSRYNIPMTEQLDDLEEKIRHRLKEKLTI
jgi:hypothetical protein